MMAARFVVGTAATLVAALTPVVAAVPADAQAVSECLVEGGSTIEPGLGLLPVPVPNTYNFSGITYQCAGLTPGGQFAGTMQCFDSLATCVGLGAISFTSSPVGPCSGTMDHVGVVYTFSCASASATVRGTFVASTANGSSLPVTVITLLGEFTFAVP